MENYNREEDVDKGMAGDDKEFSDSDEEQNNDEDDDDSEEETCNNQDNGEEIRRKLASRPNQGNRSTDYSVHKRWAETADNIKARTLAIEEYVKGYHGA